MAALTQDQIESLVAALDARFRVVTTRIREEAERAGDTRFSAVLGHGPGDSGDQSMADALAEMSVSVLEHEIRELRGIELARARMRAGEYGTCTECGAEIGFARLVAQPTAVRCVACQEKFEHTHAGGSRPRF